LHRVELFQHVDYGSVVQAVQSDTVGARVRQCFQAVLLSQLVDFVNDRFPSFCKS
jgi:hypothetical protein